MGHYERALSSKGAPMGRPASVGAAEDRDQWIERTATTTLAPLADHGYMTDQLRALAATMYDLEITRETMRSEGLSPRTILRQAVLVTQPGLSAAVAVALASTLRLPDYNRLIIPSRTAAALLEVERARLGTFRDAGRLTPAIDQRLPGLSGGTQGWWIDDVLLAIADDRQHGQNAGLGKGARRFPSLG